MEEINSKDQAISTESHKRYKAYFIGTSEEQKKDFKNSKCIMLISVGQKYHEGGELSAAVKLADKHFAFCNIMVCDTLQRHSLKLDYPQSTDEEIFSLSKKLGDEWIERNTKSLSNFAIPYTITRWDHWIAEGQYLTYHKKVCRLYNDDISYKEIVDKIAYEFLDRKNLINSSRHDSAFDLCVKYLLEESAVACLWVLNGYKYDVYPSRSNLAMITAYNKLVQSKVDYGAKSLSLNIKKFSEKTIDNISVQKYKNIATDYVLNHIPGHIYWKNQEGMFLGCNEEHAKFFGFKDPNDIIGKTNNDFLDEETAFHISQIDKKVLESGQECTIEENVGGAQHFLTKKIPLRDSNNNTIGLLGTSINVTEKIILKSDLERTVKELEKALESKTEFLNNISHEIRAPVAGFMNISQGLVDNWDNLQEDKKLDYAKKVANSAGRLATLVGHLLDLAKFNADKMILYKIEMDLMTSVDNIIGECKVLYLSNNVRKFRIKNEVKSTCLIVDSERISQVLRNLYTNAIKFSPENSLIEARVTSTSIVYEDNKSVDALHFSLSDQGPGIPESELESIFEPFSQSTRTKTKAGGTGLGLSIAKQIIEAHHGKIWAQNNQDKGATFHFAIPLSWHACEQEQGVRELMSDKVIYNGKGEEKAQIINNNKVNVLMIDDDHFVIDSIALMLGSSKYNLISTFGGEEGLNYLKNNKDKVDVILLDLMMPDIHGLEVLVKIKEDPQLSNIPIILQSGSSDRAILEKANSLGVHAYIQKPYKTKDINSVIEKALMAYNQLTSSN